MTTDYATDILAQPALLTTALQTHLAAGSQTQAAAALLRAAHGKRIILTGMGSSFYSAYPAMLTLLAAGYAVQHIELSELLHFGAAALTADSVLIIISQSGETIEAVRLLQNVKPQSTIIAVTNNPNGTLAKAAHAVVPHLAGAERAVVRRAQDGAGRESDRAAVVGVIVAEDDGTCAVDVRTTRSAQSAGNKQSRTAGGRDGRVGGE